MKPVSALLHRILQQCRSEFSQCVQDLRAGGNWPAEIEQPAAAGAPLAPQADMQLLDVVDAAEAHPGAAAEHGAPQGGSLVPLDVDLADVDDEELLEMALA